MRVVNISGRERGHAEMQVYASGVRVRGRDQGYISVRENM